MASDPRNGMEILEPEACWDLLRGQPVGRLAVCVSGEVDIFPINYVVHDSLITFKTGQGSKLAALAANARVTFEIDGYDPERGEAWSVVAKGLARVLEHFDEIYEADELPLFPWNAAPKEIYVEVKPHNLAGRRFTVVADQRPAS